MNDDAPLTPAHLALAGGVVAVMVTAALALAWISFAGG